MIIINLCKAFIFTQLVEGASAFLMGYRNKRFHVILALINLITNPLINYAIQVMFYFKILSLWIVILMEFMVIIAEWKLFEYTLPGKKASLLLLSAAINISSYIAGIFLFGAAGL